jgi:Trypsin-like peptidase domain
MSVRNRVGTKSTLPPIVDTGSMKTLNFRNGLFAVAPVLSRQRLDSRLRGNDKGGRGNDRIASPFMIRRVLQQFPVLTVLVVLLAMALSGEVLAQVSHGGRPAAAQWRTLSTPPVAQMPSINRARMITEDSLEATKGEPLRFGVPFDVHYNMNNSGLWVTLPDGSRLWRLRIECPEAFSINLIYDRFWLPPGAELFLYNEDQSMVLGAFTEQNNKPHEQFATGLLKGDVCIVEYHEPAGVNRPGIVSIERVVSGYRNLFDSDELKDALDFGSSGSCNNNVNCPEGALWQSDNNSVALITTSGGFRLCSGALVNNVRQDLKPYLLTANHCLGSEATWVFIFNYESPTCANINGPTSMSVSGATLRATNASSDFALLELSEEPPDSYDVYYAGWSAVDIVSTNSVAIHHPSGDIKKISFDNQPSQSTSYLGNTAGNGSHWRIVQWDDGTTEPGSSGSPLFDQNHRIIGQLHGGYASCASLTSDWYGKVSRSWTGGGTPSTRLRDWLDPDNTGTTVLDGRDGIALVVLHAALPDTADTLSDFNIIATIHTRGVLLGDSALLHYNVNSVDYLDTLVPTGNPNEYLAIIPRQSPATTIDYFFTAVNSLGDHDTTQIYSFTVLGTSVEVSSSVPSKLGVSGDIISFDATISNRGSFEDSYDLSVILAEWTTEITDTFGIPITTTPTLLTGGSYPVRLSVTIGASQLGETDALYLVAASTLVPPTQDTFQFSAISEGVPLILPFSETFSSSVLDDSKWAYGTAIGMTTNAANMPDPPYALELDGYPTGADTIISRPIDLSSASGAILSYFYEEGGFSEPADSGDDLSVDYYDNGGQWQPLTVHFGAGPSMPLFDKREILLPAGALHNRCRIRLRSTAQNGEYDYWFVDNILISLPSPSEINVATTPIIKWLAPNDSSLGSLIIQNQGSGALSGTLNFAPDTKRQALKENLERRDAPVQSSASNGGGPDVFGYTWKSSDDAGGPVYSWIDVSPFGEDLVDAMNDDNIVGPLNLGFSFPWYGNLYSQIYIGSNGIVGFAWPGMELSSNTAMPNNALPNGIIAWLWDDLDPDNLVNGNGHAYFDTAGGRCVISFYNYPEYQASAGDVVSAQVVLNPDGSALLQYYFVGLGFDVSNCTVGIENADGSDGLSIVHETPYLHSNLAIRISPPDNWFTLKSQSFTIAGAGVDTVLYEFDATGLDTGIYTGTLTINSNDDDESHISIPIELSRPAVLPYICGDVNNDRNGPNIVDIAALIAYLFRNGTPPTVLASADVNNSGGNPNVIDIVYLVRYLFSGGSAPDCP